MIMEYEKHGINTAFGFINPENISFRKNYERNVGTLNKVMSVSENKTITTNNIFKRLYRRNGFPSAYTSLPDAWLSLIKDSITASTSNKLLPYDVITGFAEISEPTISICDESDSIIELSECETYIDLKNLLLSMKDSISELLWNKINIKMTECINRILCQKLSIHKSVINIDDFCNDIEALVNEISQISTYGPVIHNAFISKQSTYIKSNLYVSKWKVVSEPEVDDAVDNVNPEIIPIETYLTNYYTLTYIGLSSKTLDIDLEPNIGTIVAEDMFTDIYGLLVNIFKNAKIEESKTNIKFNRHLIETSNCKMEATIGDLGTDQYLLTLIK